MGHNAMFKITTTMKCRLQSTTITTRLNNTNLESVYECEVVDCDVVVIVLHVTECFLVVPDETIHLQILPFFHGMDLGFPLQIQFFPQRPHL